MAAIIYMYYNFNISDLLWAQKINIISSIFLGLSIYSYFYEKKVVKRKIFQLKKQSEKFKIIKRNLIIIKMSTEETFQLKEILNRVEDNSNRVESEFRKEFKSIHEKIDNKISAVIKVLTDYIIINDKRVGELEGNHKVTKKEIAIYISLFSTFAMLVINLYMSLKQ